ncbi:MAG: hypothetical protein OXF56_14430 [Rhodobacteraceae bacterium]|nr:hypothetical protein [Paracoccaceae bacterium]
MRDPLLPGFLLTVGLLVGSVIILGADFANELIKSLIVVAAGIGVMAVMAYLSR